MNIPRYNKHFIVEMLTQTSHPTAESRAQNASPAILPMVAASRPASANLSADDAIALTVTDVDQEEAGLIGAQQSAI